MIRRLSILVLLVVSSVALGCAPRAMRGGEGTENPSMDDPAMSTGLDRSDIARVAARELDRV